MTATHATRVTDLTERRTRRDADLAWQAHIAAVQDWHDRQHEAGTLHKADLDQCGHPVCSSLAEVLTGAGR